MDEGAIVTNVATILAKDLLLDKGQKFRSIPYPVQQFRNFLDDDDEGLDIFIYNMLRNRNIKRIGNGGRTTDQTHHFTPTEDSSSVPDTVVIPVPMFNIPMSSLEVNLRIAQFLPVKDFEQYFHMKKCTFNALLEVLNPLMKDQIREINGSRVSRETFLSLALWKLSTSQHFEEIAQRFKIPVVMCHQSTSNFCELISNFVNTFISWPSTHRISQSGTNLLSQPLGFIGTKLLDVFLESEDEEVPIILQLVCTSDMIITDCYLDLASTYSCQNSPIFKKLNSELGSSSNGFYLMGDDTFPLKTFLITPYSKVKDERRVNFNRIIENRSMIVQSTISQMMNRYQAMYSLEGKDLKEIKKIVETICGLHNFCRRFNDNIIPKLPESRAQKQKLQIKGDESDVLGLNRRNELLQAFL